MTEDKIKEFYNIYSNLESLKNQLYEDREDYDKSLEKIKNFDKEFKAGRLLPWFEFIKLAFTDKYIDFKKRDLLEELNKVMSVDFGIDFYNNAVNFKDIEFIKQSINDIKAVVENKGDLGILNKIYDSIETAYFINEENIKNIIDKNKPNNVLNSVKGKFAEYKFIEYLNKKNKKFFYIDNTKNSMCNALRHDKAKRPDLILMLDNIFRVFVDVKNYSKSKKNEFGINKNEIENFINLEKQYSIPVFLAISNGELKFNTWYLTPVKKIFDGKKDLIKKNYKGTDDLYYINSDDSIFYKADITNEFNDKFLIENNSEILNIIKTLTDKYFKNL